MNQVKEDLDYFKTYDYIIKADVVKIKVNKIDDLKLDDIELDEKSYRWKGVFKDKHSNQLDMIKHGTQTKIYSNIKRIIWTQIMKHP